MIELLDLNNSEKSNIKVIISCRTSEISDSKISEYLQLSDYSKPTSIWYLCPFNDE